MRNAHVYLLAAVLTAIGLGLSAYKMYFVGLPLRASAAVSAWQVESEIRVNANGGPLKISMYVPEDAQDFSVLDHRVAAPEFGITVAAEGPNRRLNLTLRNATGQMTARQTFIIHKNELAGRDRRAVAPAHEQITLSQTGQRIARSLFTSAHSRSADDISLVSVLLRELSSTDRSESVRSLLGDDRSQLKIASLAAQILRVNNYGARAVHGLDLAKTGLSMEVISWLEVDVGDRRQPFSIPAGEPRIPSSYFAWWRGDAPLVHVDGGKIDRQRVTVSRVEQSVLHQVLSIGKRDESFLVNYSLYDLPATQRQVFRVVMTIPIGVFLLLIVRNIIGLRGVGTFMPVLIALAFRETGLPWGLALFSLVLASGLLVRLYFDHLKLLLVARLAAILMFVILLMAVITILASKLNIERGLSIALFPLVILTMTIERISVLWDERGPGEAVKQAVLSLVIATICYLVMSAQAVQHVFFAFPEIVLVLIALTLLIGRYTGYRLTELVRFRALAEPRP